MPPALSGGKVVSKPFPQDEKLPCISHLAESNDRMV
jgi:hypothetical protein